MEGITDGTSNTIAFSEGIIFDRNLSAKGGNKKARIAVGVADTGNFTGIPTNCLAVADGKNLKADQDASNTANDIYHQLGMRAFDWYVFGMAFYTLMPPNSPSCTYQAQGSWVGDVWVSASSNHTGGVNASMMDGSVQFVSDTIGTQNLGRGSTSRSTPQDAAGPFSYGIWASLGSINGGESASIP